ncbi:MAG: hypothetical protein FWG83_04710 [Oscillospiraceae bacterium]|nr:hypothetical protein [Oscillospiraceae bacterium]
MEINNNSEINKMFGTEDEPILPPPEPELHASPNPNDLSGMNSPFQGGDYSSNTAFDGEFGVKIGDHSLGFAVAGKGRRIGARTMFILFPLLVFLGAAGGAFACYTYFFGLHISSEESAARTAADSICDFLHEKEEPPQRIIFNEIFVNNRFQGYTCVAFATVKLTDVQYETMIFKVIINEKTDEITVIREFEPEEFERLSQGSKEEQILAATMLNQYYEFVDALDEIQSRSGDWERVNPIYINTGR